MYRMLCMSIDAGINTVPHVMVRVCSSYTIACPPVRGDNPRALASGLSYRWTNMV